MTRNYNYTLSLLIGLGGGKFAEPVYLTLPGVLFADGITVADFNLDGKADLAVSVGADFTQQALILLGHGDGTFSTPVGYDVYPRGSGGVIASADFNHDGLPDLATGNLSVLLGNGDGTFRDLKYYDAFVAGVGLKFADLDGDGNLDAIQAGTYLGPNAVAVLRGNADGSFQPAVLFGSSTFCPYALAVADFNRDGHLDVVVPDSDESRLTLFLGDANGTFPARRDYNLRQPAVGNEPETFEPAVGDLNSDGNPDVALADYLGNQVILVLGRSNGTFGVPEYVPTASYPFSTAVGDLNGDGNADIVTSNSGVISVLLGEGNNKFQEHVDYPTLNSAGFLVLGDVNGDGKLDVIATETSREGCECIPE